MTITERLNLFFNKEKCIKVIITDTNKRVKSYIIKIGDNNTFNVGNRTYVINYESVFSSNGLPTYFYYIENPASVSTEELRISLLPLEMQKASMQIEINSSEFYDAIEETITRKIIRYAEDGDKRIINTILLTGLGLFLGMAGGMYFLYMQIDKVLIFIAENRDVIQLIKESLISGVGN